MDNAENEENSTYDKPRKQPPLPNTVELCTLCTQYVYAYTFHLDQVLKRVLT